MGRDVCPCGFSGGPWPSRAVGRERGHRRSDGGGDWYVRGIGVDDNQQQYAHDSVRNHAPHNFDGYEDYGDGRVFSPAKMEFPPYDGLTNAVEWLQKCDDYFVDQRIFNDDVRLRQATFLLTGHAYHWNNNLRRLFTRRLSWAEFKIIYKSRFGKAASVNPMGELSNLRHISTVDDYYSQSEECLGRGGGDKAIRGSTIVAILCGFDR
ncbi:hypothetical protein Rs2_38604 [Raphanus sativus]|nr:hypothetical protein Rs2_38604 [Raphanus sativus]